MLTLQPSTLRACPARFQSTQQRRPSRHIPHYWHKLSPRASVSQENTSTAETTPAPNTCRTCGVSLSEIPRGCDQEGRIAGGIGAVLGFDWWPIKAYRPCPIAAKAGLLYTRKGQITDEMLFGDRKKKE